MLVRERGVVMVLQLRRWHPVIYISFLAGGAFAAAQIVVVLVRLRCLVNRWLERVVRLILRHGLQGLYRQGVCILN